MKYPMLSTTLRFKRIRKDAYLISDDASGSQYVFKSTLALFARYLNGFTNPYSIKGYKSKEVTYMLHKLAEVGLIRTSRFYKHSLSTSYVTLLPLSLNRKRRQMHCLVNAAIMLLWLPALLTGLACLLHRSAALWNASTVDIIFGAGIGYFTSVLLHEFSHYCSATAYHAHCYELGIVRRFFILPGAYILMSDERVSDPFQRIQIAAAGIEMNFLFAGLMFGASTFIKPLSATLFFCGLVNFNLSLANLIPIRGNDGERIINEALSSLGVIFKRKHYNKQVCHSLKIISIILFIILSFWLTDKVVTMAFH